MSREERKSWPPANSCGPAKTCSQPPWWSENPTWLYAPRRIVSSSEAGGLQGALPARPASLLHAKHRRICPGRAGRASIYNRDTSPNAESSHPDNWSSEKNRIQLCRGVSCFHARMEERNSGLNSSSQSMQSSQSFDASEAPWFFCSAKLSSLRE